MKVVYYANHQAKDSDDTQGHLTKALLELGHEVDRVQIGERITDGDLLLCHKAIPQEAFNGKKVCWYFDKVWGDRWEYIKQALNYCDIVAMTDEAWTDRHPHPKYRIVRQGIGDPKLGQKYNLAAKMAFVGTLYEDRFDWAAALCKKYGKDFQIFEQVYNRQFNDLCASVPIFLAPTYPSNDKYWSNRVYLTIGSGGFLIHPRLTGLEKEYKDGEEIVFYDDMDDLFAKVDYYLGNPEERERIRLAGWEKTKSEYTYKKRLEHLLTLV